MRTLWKHLQRNPGFAKWVKEGMQDAHESLAKVFEKIRDDLDFKTSGAETDNFDQLVKIPFADRRICNVCYNEQRA